MTVKKSLLWTFLSEYSVFVVNFITSLIVARLLAPSEFGIFAIAITLTELLVMIRQAGIGRYIVQTKDLDEERLRSALGVMIILCITFALIIAIAASAVSRFYGYEQLKPVLLIIAIAFLLVPFSQPGMALMERRLQFQSLMWLNLSAAIALGLVSIFSAISGFKAISLALGYIAMQIVLLLGVLICRPEGQVFLPGLSKWREVISFGRFAISSNLLTYFGNSAPTAVLGRIVDIGSVGLYSRALGLTSMIKQLTQAAISRAMYAQMAMQENQAESLNWAYVRAIGLCTVLAWTCATVLYVTATPIISFLYGTQWSGAGPLFGNLCIAMALQATAPLYVEIMFIKGRQASLIKRDLCLNLFALLNFAFWAFHSVWAATLARSVDAALLVAIYLPLLLKLTQAERRDVLVVLLRSLAVAFLTALPAIAVMHYHHWPQTLRPLVLILLGFITFVTWIMALFVVRHPLAADLQSLLISMKGTKKA